jgi:hypothetical protein
MIEETLVGYRYNLIVDVMYYQLARNNYQYAEKAKPQLDKTLEQLGVFKGWYRYYCSFA